MYVKYKVRPALRLPLIFVSVYPAPQAWVVREGQLFGFRVPRKNWWHIFPFRKRLYVPLSPLS